MTKRIAITGMSMITPLGQGLEENWSAIREGKVAYDFNEDYLKSKSPVVGLCEEIQVPENILSAKEHSRVTQNIRGILYSTNEALNISKPRDYYESDKIGCVIGSGGPCGKTGYEYYEDLRKKGRTSPFVLPNSLTSMPAAYVSMKFGLNGPNMTIAAACASSLYSLIVACDMIRSGTLDCVVSGGVDISITPNCLWGFKTMGAASKGDIDNPEKSSKPFSKDRDGFIMSEACGILILEDYDKAVERGATISAVVEGYAMNSDAFHMSSPREDGKWVSKCMDNAINNSNIPRDQIKVINAHGTATKVGDVVESAAIERVFGDLKKDLVVTANKSIVGHSMGAAASVEMILGIKGMNEGIVLPTINLEEPDEKCTLNYSPNKETVLDHSYFLKNSLGFGGVNASIVIGKK